MKRLKGLGLEFHRQAAGSHEIWFNPALNRYTTIPNHPGDMPEATLRAILKQAGIDVKNLPSDEMMPALSPSGLDIPESPSR